MPRFIATTDFKIRICLLNQHRVKMNMIVKKKNVLTTVLVAILLLVLITFMFLRNLGIIAGCIKLIALE